MDDLSTMTAGKKQKRKKIYHYDYLFSHLEVNSKKGLLNINFIDIIAQSDT